MSWSTLRKVQYQPRATLSSREFKAPFSDKHQDIGQLRCHFSKWVVTTNITFSEKNKKHRIWPLEPELFKKQTLKTLRQREVSHFQQNMSRCRPKFACFWSQFSRVENWKCCPVFFLSPVWVPKRCGPETVSCSFTKAFVLVQKSGNTLKNRDSVPTGNYKGLWTEFIWSGQRVLLCYLKVTHYSLGAVTRLALVGEV